MQPLKSGVGPVEPVEGVEIADPVTREEGTGHRTVKPRVHPVGMTNNHREIKTHFHLSPDFREEILKRFFTEMYEVTAPSELNTPVPRTDLMQESNTSPVLTRSA